MICAACPDADDPRQVEIGFTLSPQHQGHGYATEAARLLLGYLFGLRGKHRVTGECDARNAASALVLASARHAGQEGHLRESTWAKGEWTDDLVFAILDRYWPPPSVGRGYLISCGTGWLRAASAEISPRMDGHRARGRSWPMPG